MDYDIYKGTRPAISLREVEAATNKFGGRIIAAQGQNTTKAGKRRITPRFDFIKVSSPNDDFAAPLRDKGYEVVQAGELPSGAVLEPIEG